MQPFNPYDIVAALENKVAEYGGVPYAVAVDSCTNALLIALRYHRMINSGDTVILPKQTYVGVAYAALNAGYKIEFEENQWQGAYTIGNTNIIDSARRFTKNMYVPGSFYCLSAHWGKHLKIGRGGFILTDNRRAANDMRRMRFDGRQAGVRPTDDNFTLPGYHCYMLPSEAAHGIMLMASMPDYNADIPWDDYTDLSQYPIFTEGYK
jgi:dTDP-4-amino-4,6-dideoxygalactose transaminase